MDRLHTSTSGNSVDVAVPTIAGISLCSGVAGLELGISLAVPGYRTVCHVEGEAYAAGVLAARMEDQAISQAPIWSDVRTFDGRPWRGVVDIVTAGYPCQPFSAAGRRLGEDDPRHLWPHVARVIAEARPPLVFCENVSAHLSLGFDSVAEDMEGLGYRVAAGIFSAAMVGAPHQRDRLFWLAVADAHDAEWRENHTGPRSGSSRNDGLSGIAPDARGSGYPEIPRGLGKSKEKTQRKRSQSPKKPVGRVYQNVPSDADEQGPQGRSGLEQAPTWRECETRERQDTPGRGRIPADPDRRGLKREREPGVSRVKGARRDEPDGCGDGVGEGPSPWDRRQAPPPVCGMDDGVAHRVDRLRACGNGVVPLVAARAFICLLRELTE